jgi:hypothetical protein
VEKRRSNVGRKEGTKNALLFQGEIAEKVPIKYQESTKMELRARGKSLPRKGSQGLAEQDFASAKRP